ncbi:MAG TPA: molybdopterin dinucleotide binding domain-containing protein, partial [Desulfobacteria bacterium]|nr:molybdopterin dinucleotide binding domain-containing protein [Desulfobacteria bacterium]
NFNYASPAAIMDEIASLNPAYAGVSYDRLEEDGLQWPVPDKNHPGTKFLHADKFSRGLGLLQGIEYQPPAEGPDEKYPIMLTTGRMLFHYGTSTRNSKALNTYRPEERAEVNPVDAERIGVEDGGFMKVESRRGKLVTKIRITDRVPAGVIFMTHHYLETPTNELTNGAYDKVTKTYEYKVCGVRISKVDKPVAQSAK